MFLNPSRYLLISLCSFSFNAKSAESSLWRLQFNERFADIFAETIFPSEVRTRPFGGNSGGYAQTSILRSYPNIDGTSLSFSTLHHRTLLWCDIYDAYNYGRFTICAVEFHFDAPAVLGEDVSREGADRVRVTLKGETAKILRDGMMAKSAYPFSKGILNLRGKEGILRIQCFDRSVNGEYRCQIEASRGS